MSGFRGPVSTLIEKTKTAAKTTLKGQLNGFDFMFHPKTGGFPQHSALRRASDCGRLSSLQEIFDGKTST